MRCNILVFILVVLCTTITHTEGNSSSNDDVCHAKPAPSFTIVQASDMNPSSFRALMVKEENVYSHFLREVFNTTHTHTKKKR